MKKQIEVIDLTPEKFMELLWMLEQERDGRNKN